MLFSLSNIKSFQSYDDVLEQGLTLYFWSDTIHEEDLKRSSGAAHQLYQSGKGVASEAEAVEAIMTDKGIKVLEIYQKTSTDHFGNFQDAAVFDSGSGGSGIRGATQ